ncbi:aminotransferase class I/II-fold pyridoxal phosphate-dependent enzyme [Pseudonocardia sp. N23]|uniref:aminotransferase class I/II-fold pyridoxal phosphate-dependent enzyme n=1 Tax=Pseudonocardia sp. N23 TaxID=1987376 RepID=UPI000BFC507C|nr:aminotransferase class I/II-fold pyridoxal phosphate-dependent enzyme [Pseudonocardia sp. N23]RTL65366.1 MAG: aminotransferase class I/II-fold pyridoxal phosphate-dependent enzyme [Pseudonocardiaceae bacterium]
MRVEIRGRTAAEIATNIRALVDTGELEAGDGLPASRDLAARLGVNRNTVVSAYRQLARAGVAVTNRGGGTSITRPACLVEEGFAPDTALRDVSHGNPDRGLLPDATTVRLLPQAPVLYGESTIDPGLAQWATPWFKADQPRAFRLTVTSGAVDAIEKLLAQILSQGDSVALEDPCYLTSINTVRQAGYHPIAVPIDQQGMIAAALREALEPGVRAVVCTPRAHNPTGVSLSAERAAELRQVLADHPHVLVIEDDHFSLLSTCRYHTLIPADHERWALVRSMSKFLGPDLRVAVVASDPVTADRFGTQISGGTRWVSHHLQRTVHAMLGDKGVRAVIEKAGVHYRDRNARFIRLLHERGITAIGDDGVNIWVDTGPGSDTAAVAAQLMHRGWVVRTGDSFALGTSSGAERLRLTVHELDDGSAALLADALLASITATLPAGALR